MVQPPIKVMFTTYVRVKRKESYKMKRWKSILVLPLILFLSEGNAGQVKAQVPRVVVTIKPLYSLAAQIMQGVGEPYLLIQSSLSPHMASLKTKDVRAIEKADVVVWVGPTMESGYAKVLRQEQGAYPHKVLELTKVKGMTVYPYRQHGKEEAACPCEKDSSSHSHKAHSSADSSCPGTDNIPLHSGTLDEGCGHHHDHVGVDGHIWLNTENALKIGKAIMEELVKKDQGHSHIYKENYQRLASRLSQLKETMRHKLEPIKDRPFIVFHDAYQYLEKEFNLSGNQGAMTIEENIPISSKHLKTIKTIIKARNIKCVFKEPQFQAKIMETLAEEDLAITINQLDPLGALDKEKEGSYFSMMQRLADSLYNCLKDKDADLSIR